MKDHLYYDLYYILPAENVSDLIRLAKTRFEIHRVNEGSHLGAVTKQ
jgi:hypothetical protein